MRQARLATLALLAVAGCAEVGKMIGSSLEKPRLTFVSVTPQAADLEGVTLLVRYRVENPNSVGLTVATLDYQLDVDGKQALTGSQRSGLSLPIRGAADLDVPVRLRYAAVPDFLRAVFQKEQIAFQLTGNAGVQTPVGVLQVPFSASGKVPAPRLPQLSLAGATVHAVSFDGLSFEVALEVANPNAFPLPAGALGYALRLGDYQVLTAASQALGAVPARGKGRVVVPVKVPFSAAAEAVGKLLRGGQADVALKGSASFGSVGLPVDLAGKVGR
jgi:LEA14-like dessication related protein